MSKTLREVGIDCLGVDPFLKKVGLPGDMTVDELKELLRREGYGSLPQVEPVDIIVIDPEIELWVVRERGEGFRLRPIAPAHKGSIKLEGVVPIDGVTDHIVRIEARRDSVPFAELKAFPMPVAVFGGDLYHVNIALNSG